MNQKSFLFAACLGALIFAEPAAQAAPANFSGEWQLNSARSAQFQGATPKQRDIWTLSADGETLSLDSHVSLPNGEFDVKQVFEKR